jgi:hypothetical protein
MVVVHAEAAAAVKVAGDIHMCVRFFEQLHRLGGKIDAIGIVCEVVSEEAMYPGRLADT